MSFKLTKPVKLILYLLNSFLFGVNVSNHNIMSSVIYGICAAIFCFSLLKD